MRARTPHLAGIVCYGEDDLFEAVEARTWTTAVEVRSAQRSARRTEEAVRRSKADRERNQQRGDDCQLRPRPE